MLENRNSIIRILHMIGSLEIGGSQTMILNLYKAINREKIQFDFIIDHGDAISLVPEVEALGAKVYTMPQFKGYNVLEIKKAWNHFFNEHPEYKILHSHVRSYASLYIPIAKRHGVKTIVHSHSTSNGKGVASAMKKMLQYPLRYQADYLFACSKEAGEWLYGKKAARKNNFKIINNGIDCDRFCFNEANRMVIRKELGIENNFVVGNVARHTFAKNSLFLIEIFAEIYRRNQNARLLQIGEGELTGQMKEKCIELGVNDATIFVGMRTDVEKYYSAMDVFLFPSRWEGLGMVAIEAQTNGLHIISSDIVPELADIGAGLFHSLSLDSSAGQWAEKILKEKYHERRTDAAQYAKQTRHNLLCMVEEIEDIYLSMMEDEA